MNTLIRKIEKIERDLEHIQDAEQKSMLQERLDNLRHQLSAHTEHVTPTCAEQEQMLLQCLGLEE